MQIYTPKPRGSAIRVWFPREKPPEIRLVSFIRRNIGGKEKGESS
jgi:hypothetical protein